jgi:hypothetical protein
MRIYVYEIFGNNLANARMEIELNQEILYKFYNLRDNKVVTKISSTCQNTREAIGGMHYGGNLLENIRRG